MNTMGQVYMDAAKACGLKPGDRVRVTRKAENREAGWYNDWMPGMDKCVGQIGIISNQAVIGSTFGIRVDFSSGHWNFPYFALEKVDDEPVRTFKKGDYVRVLRGWEPSERGVNLRPLPEVLNQTIGKVGRIVGAGGNTYRVEFPAPIDDWWGYPWFVLEPAEKPEPEFTPFQKVLVRDYENDAWEASLYSHYDKSDTDPFYTVAGSWKYCVPYEGNEHLLGTTEAPNDRD